MEEGKEEERKENDGDGEDRSRQEISIMSNKTIIV